MQYSEMYRNIQKCIKWLNCHLTGISNVLLIISELKKKKGLEKTSMKWQAKGQVLLQHSHLNEALVE